MSKDNVYTYYRLDFKNCNLGYDYDIVESIDIAKDYLLAVDTELDDPESDASVKITGVGMTRDQYNAYLKSCED